jgi:hypothetical protein
MSYYDYETGRKLEMTELPFYGIIQAAMRRADNENLEKLKGCFPEVWDDLQKRYNAPGGKLEND